MLQASSGNGRAPPYHYIDSRQIYIEGSYRSDVDVRRIQITGGSSFMITLPKEWAESVGLQKNDPVGLQAQPDGSMVIYPAGSDSSDRSSTKVIGIDYDYDLDFLYRQLVGAYIAGHDIIEVVSDCDISSSIAGRISSFVRTAIGLEIMEEDDRHIVIKDLMDQNEIRPMRSIERMKVLVRNMLNDVLDALESKDASLLESIDGRDREVDRIHWLISRQVNIHQKDITISRRQGVDLCSITRSGTIAKTIERIGDHAVLLAENLRPLIDDDTTDDVDAEILRTGREVVMLFIDSVHTWTDKDVVNANRCIERGVELVEKSLSISRKSEELMGKPAIAAKIISSSVKRIAEYSMDICETAINAAME